MDELERSTILHKQQQQQQFFDPEIVFLQNDICTVSKKFYGTEFNINTAADIFRIINVG